MKKSIETLTLVKKGRKWWEVKNGDYINQLVIDENTKELEIGAKVTGVFEVLKEFPFQYRLSDDKIEDFQKDSNRKQKLKTYERYLQYVREHKGFYTNGFEVLDSIVEELQDDTLKIEVLEAKKQARSRQYLNYLQSCNNPYNLAKYLDYFTDKEFINKDEIIQKYTNKIINSSINMLKDQFNYFNKSNVLDVNVISKVNNLLDLINRFEESINNDDIVSDCIEIVNETSSKIEDYLKGTLPDIEFNEIIRTALKNRYSAKFNPNEKTWHVPSKFLAEARELIGIKEEISIQDVYNFMLSNVEEEKYTDADMINYEFPQSWNWIKKQYVLGYGITGNCLCIHKKTKESCSKKNAFLEYNIEDLQNYVVLEFRKGSHKYLYEYLFVKDKDGYWRYYGKGTVEEIKNLVLKDKLNKECILSA